MTLKLKFPNLLKEKVWQQILLSLRLKNKLNLLRHWRIKELFISMNKTRKFQLSRQLMNWWLCTRTTERKAKSLLNALKNLKKAVNCSLTWRTRDNSMCRASLRTSQLTLKFFSQCKTTQLKLSFINPLTQLWTLTTKYQAWSTKEAHSTNDFAKYSTRCTRSKNLWFLSINDFKVAREIEKNNLINSFGGAGGQPPAGGVPQGQSN